MKDRVDDICEQLGLNGPYPDDEYVEQMELQWREKATAFLDAIDWINEYGAGPDDLARIHRLKNADWQMSRYVSAHCCSTLYRECLSWLAANIKPGAFNVIDLGCDIGLLTLGIGKLFPEAQVVGLDNNNLAVNNAMKLRDMSAIRNVEFVVRDIAEPLQHELTEFDIVICTWVLHEMLPSVLKGDGATEREEAVLRNIADMVSNDGEIVTVNRFPQTDLQTDNLTSLMETVGLVETVRDVIWAEEGDEMSVFPVAVYRKGSETKVG